MTLAPDGRPWGVAVFTARETVAQLEGTLRAALAAARAPGSTIDLLVNGNLCLARDAAALAARLCAPLPPDAPRCRVWFVPLGDKSHAWNQYLHHIWPGDGPAFFVDGYVRLRADALALIDAGLAQAPDALAATGVPSVGRTAAALRAQMLAQGGIHGNLYALKASTMHRLRDIGYRLPLGLYRTDPTLGAALAFGLDPAAGRWDLPGRILVHPQATWDTDEKRFTRLGDLVGQFKRQLRQGQGLLENLAVHDLYAVRGQAAQALPPTAAQLVDEWAASHRGALARQWLRHPLAVGRSLRELRRPRDWSAASRPSEQLFPPPGPAPGPA